MLQESVGQRAVVMGGSISGMLAARVLADFFDEVIIIEADDMPDIKHARKRVPQGQHSHVLLQAGQQVLERCFPNFVTELIADGSVVLDFTNDLEWFHFGNWKKRFESGIIGVQQTRPFLEWHIQRRLMDYSNINIHHNCLVVGFKFSSDQRTIQGVKVREHNDLSDNDIICDLVVDATGYGSQSRKWMPELPSQSPVEAVKIDLFYATRFYQTDNSNLGWKNLMISAQLPYQPYAGVILSFEENKFGVTLGGYLKQPPKTHEEFKAIARSLPQPHIHEFLQHAKPISDLNTYRIPSQVRNRFDRSSNMPSHLIVMGDAYCRFDPLYGQGMSVAFLEAELLGNELRSMKHRGELNTLHNRFHKKLVRLTQGPWDMAITESFRHPDISGQRPRGIKLMQWLTQKIYKASANQQDVYLALAQVMNLTTSSSAFFRPALLPKLFFQFSNTDVSTPAGH
jgi:2-polyprenyl-6-methoxyphenol hydroxylase-like FAD-dependent oxidoreductase